MSAAEVVKPTPTPGPWDHDGQTVFADTRQRVCCGRGRDSCCGDPDVEGELSRVATVDSPGDIDLIAEVGTVLHETGKTPRQLFAERDSLAEDNAALRLEVERLTRERDALLAVAKSFRDLTNESYGVSGYHLNGAIAAWISWDEFDLLVEMDAALALAEQQTAGERA